MQKKSALTFIFITLVLDITGFGLIIPVIPTLLKQLTGASTSEASNIASYLAFTYAGMQFIFSPILGNLSDKYGRRPVLLASMFGFGLDYIILSIAPTLGWLFLARALSGLTGASITAASAYIADVSTSENRAKNFGLIGAAFGIGFILGPSLGGVLGHISTRLPFIVAAILSFTNFAFGYFILPESLSDEHRRDFDWKRANPIGSFKRLKSYPQLLGLFLVVFLVYVGSHAVHSQWSFFTIEKFHWTESMIGLSLGLVGVLVGVVQGGLVRWINPKIGDEKSIFFGLLFYALGMFLFASASQSWMMYAYLVPYCLGGIAGPAIQSMLAGSVSPKEQGEVQGLNTAVVSVTSILGPLIMNNVFYYFTKPDTKYYLPGASFILGGALFLLAAFISSRYFKNRKTNA